MSKQTEAKTYPLPIQLAEVIKYPKILSGIIHAVIMMPKNIPNVPLLCFTVGIGACHYMPWAFSLMRSHKFQFFILRVIFRKGSHS